MKLLRELVNITRGRRPSATFTTNVLPYYLKLTIVLINANGHQFELINTSIINTSPYSPDQCVILRAFRDRSKNAFDYE